MFRLPSSPLYATLADKLGWWAVRALCVAVLAFLLAPILVMVPLSFSESSFLAYPIHGWSLKWYQNLFGSPEWARATRNSFIVAPAATLIATVLAALAGFNHNLVRASLSLGETPLNTFFRITLPVIAPGVVSGALFAFAISFDEVVVTLFLAGADQSTLPRQMFNGIRENISPTIAAVATLLILFTTSLLLALEWLRGRRA